MEGYADFKSHVLRRDEKGIFGIPFKRLLGCGLGGGRHPPGGLDHLLDRIANGDGHALDLLAGLAALLGGDAQADHRPHDGAVDQTSDVCHD